MTQLNSPGFKQQLLVTAIAIVHIMSERRRSSLLSQLGRAQTKISALEEFIRDRERQFHTAVTRLESRPQPGGGTTRRRVGLSHDLLRMRSLSSSSTEEHRDESGGNTLNC